MKDKKRGANVRVQRNEFFKNRTSIKKKLRILIFSILILYIMLRWISKNIQKYKI